MTAVDAARVHGWAERLYARAPGWVAVCTFPNKRSRHVRADDPAGIAQAAADLASDQDVYLSALTLREPPRSGRGGGDLAHALIDVWADLDIVGPTHKDNDGLPVDVAGAHRILDEIPIPPTVVIHSGGGLQPRWVLGEPWILDTAADRAEAEKFLRRWGDVVTAAAGRAGYKTDSGVWDLARVLRAPGTWNRKAIWYGTGDQAFPIDYHSYRGAGIRYARDAISDLFLPEPADMPDSSPPMRAGGDGWSAADWVNQHVSWDELLHDWTKGDTDRNGITYWTRPGKNPRAGNSATTREVPPVLVNFSTDDDVGLPVGKGRKLTKFRVYAHRFHRGDESEAARAVYDQHGQPKGPRHVEALSGAPKSTPPAPIRVRRASSYTPRQAQFTFGGRIQLGHPNLLVGIGGLNKSTLTVRIAAAATCGLLDGDLAGRPVNVLLASAEDGIEDVIIPRLMAAGADLDRIIIPDEPFVLPNDAVRLGALIAAESIGLVSVDPIVAYLEREVDSHKDADVRRALLALRPVTEEHDVTALGVAHLNKTRSKDIYTRISGSVGFFNAARSVMAMTADPDARDDHLARVLWHEKCNAGPRSQPQRVRLAQTMVPDPDGVVIDTIKVDLGEWLNGSDIGDALGDDDRDERSARQMAKDCLAEAFQAGDGQVNSKELAKLAGQLAIDVRTVRRAAHDLGAKPGRVGFGKEQTMVWTLLADHTESPNTPPERTADTERTVDTRDRSVSPVPSEAAGTTERHCWTRADVLADCTVCGNGPTLMRDPDGRPAHPSCIEEPSA